MHFRTINTHAAYRALMQSPTPAERAQIFCDQLAAPFAGLGEKMGIPDPVAAFQQWGMSPDQYVGDQRDHWQSTLDALTTHHAWQRAANSLERAKSAFASHLDRIALGEIVFGLYLADLSAMPLARGYSGFGAIPGYIMTIYGDATPYNLERVEACTVHELHHNIWSTLYPGNFMMTTTVGEYMIMEGLAESFAGELYGEDSTGPWVQEFDESRLEHTIAQFRDGLSLTGFNTIRAYIFGGTIARMMNLGDIDLPDYAGYALGYRVVQAYLRRTNQSVVDATFIPARQIIEESQFFA